MILLFVSSGGLFLGLFIAALLLASKRVLANRVLAALMILCSLNIAHALTIIALPRVFPFPTYFLVEPMQFLMAPLIAAYFRSILLRGFSLSAKHLVHALPFLGVVAFSLSPFPVALEYRAGFPVVAAVLWAALLVQLFCYLIPSMLLLHRYRRALADEVSDFTGIDLKWLQRFSHLIWLLFLGYAIVLVLLIHCPQPSNVRVFLSVCLSIIVCALGYRGLLQKEAPALQEVLEAHADIAKYERSAMSAVEARELRNRLTRAMEEEKLYLDPELSLSTLATRVDSARNHISYVINEVLGKNFYDLVNEYRVNEVLRLMEEPSHANDKIISLAFEAGFNSKPTFNAVFKKLKGFTPSAYRRSKKKMV